MTRLWACSTRWNASPRLGLLSRFVGMLTDSRSFLSYPRHDYFRRILCNLLGEDMTRGRIPKEMESHREDGKGYCLQQRGPIL